MFTLGVWAFGRDSAVVVDDTSIVAADEKEKRGRSTGFGRGLPRMAISRCLDQGNAKTTDVTLAAFSDPFGSAGGPFAVFMRGAWIPSPSATSLSSSSFRKVREVQF